MLNEEEIQALSTCIEKLQELEQGKREPQTAQQRRFIGCCRGKSRPETIWETAYTKLLKMSPNDPVGVYRRIAEASVCAERPSSAANLRWPKPRLSAAVLRGEPAVAQPAAPATLSNSVGAPGQGTGKSVKELNAERRVQKRRVKGAWDAGPDWRSDPNWRGKV